MYTIITGTSASNVMTDKAVSADRNEISSEGGGTRRRSLSRRSLGVGLIFSLMAACGGEDPDLVPTDSETSSLSWDDSLDDRSDGLGADCKKYTVPVTLPPDTTSYNLVGWLCGGRSPKQTVLLLVHGGSYDHNYWDFPVAPRFYSFVQEARKAGYATFNIDRLGSGESSHPAPELLTNYSGAETLHQVVQALKSGSVRHRFAKVVLVGHSIGTAMSMIEASTYRDADGVLGTGLIHHLNMVNFGTAPTLAYPAVFDPKFAASGLPYGYLTTVPGARPTMFYHTPTASSTVIAKDEELKQTITVGELSTIVPATYYAGTVNIKVPVASYVGEHDFLGCGDDLECTDAKVAAYEKPFFSKEACLETKVIKHTGHDLNLHYSADAVFDRAIDWLDRRVGRSTLVRPTDRCR